MIPLRQHIDHYFTFCGCDLDTERRGQVLEFESGRNRPGDHPSVLQVRLPYRHRKAPSVLDGLRWVCWPRYRLFEEPQRKVGVLESTINKDASIASSVADEQARVIL